MGESTLISWTDHTFSPWLGCVEVSEGCANCYARTFTTNRMGLKVWGQDAPHRVTAPDYWKQPIKWNRDAHRDFGRNARVFCASMADVFEDRRDLDHVRAWLFEVIRETPNLNWQLLTKRPEKMRELAPDWLWELPNVWPGTTAENERRLIERARILGELPSRVRFLSCEPLLTPLTTIRAHLGDGGANWIICGAESGSERRAFDVAWAREIADACTDAGVPFFMKQGSAFKAGEQAGVPDDLWRRKEMPL